MKREMDLIRLVLMEAEDGEAPPELSNYTREQVLYHMELAVEAGLLDAAIAHGSDGSVKGVGPRKLTWAGHDFLDAARSDQIWRQAKRTIVEKGGAWTFDLLKALLIDLAKRSLGI